MESKTNLAITGATELTWPNNWGLLKKVEGEIFCICEGEEGKKNPLWNEGSYTSYKHFTIFNINDFHNNKNIGKLA